MRFPSWLGTLNAAAQRTPARRPVVDDLVAAGGISQPEHLVFDAGSLFVTSFDSPGKVERFDPTTGALVNIATGGLNQGDRLTVGPDGNLYAVSVSGNQVLRY